MGVLIHTQTRTRQSITQNFDGWPTDCLYPLESSHKEGRSSFVGWCSMLARKVDKKRSYNFLSNDKLEKKNQYRRANL